MLETLGLLVAVTRSLERQENTSRDSGGEVLKVHEINRTLPGQRRYAALGYPLFSLPGVG
jgi:hypothetical protein